MELQADPHSVIGPLLERLGVPRASWPGADTFTWAELDQKLHKGSPYQYIANRNETEAMRPSRFDFDVPRAQALAAASAHAHAARVSEPRADLSAEGIRISYILVLGLTAAVLLVIFNRTCK